MRRRLLWRVRRKLILSYIFVGLVPSLLIVAFFLLAGLLLFRNVASYLVQSRLNAHTEQARFLAQTVLLDVQRAGHRRGGARHPRAAAGECGGPLSLPLDRAGAGARPGMSSSGRPGASGRMPPVRLPTHGRPLGAPDGAAGLAGVDDLRRGGPDHRLRCRRREGGRGADLRLVARAVAVPPVRSPTWAVVLDLPISAAVESRIGDETGIRLGEVDRVPIDEAPGLGPGSRAEPGRGTGGRAPDRSAAAALGGVGAAPRLGDRDVGHGQRAALARAGRDVSPHRRRVGARRRGEQRAAAARCWPSACCSW